MNSPIVHALQSMGITQMAQRVATNSSLRAGRISLFHRNWKCITQDPWVLNCIMGVSMELTQYPYQSQIPNELPFSPQERENLNMEVQKMVDKQAIQRIPQNQFNKGFHSQLFIVPKKDGGQRPIINLKRLNSFVQTHHFKMEGIYMLKDLLKEGDWMTKVDLKDAYFMVPIASQHRKLLRFSWDRQVYQFNCLPFGLSSAPWTFTKVTRPLIATLRSLGMRIIIYIDDILIMAETQSLAKEHTAGLIFLLENLGFIVNHPKSILNPMQTIEYLGFEIKSPTMEMRLPGEKIKHIRQETTKLLQSENPSTRELSRLLGKLSHASQAIPPAPLFYRNMQDCLRRSLQYGDRQYQNPLHLSYEAREEMEWWKTHLTRWNGKLLLKRNPQLTIETDASNTGWGAFCQNEDTGDPGQGPRVRCTSTA